MVSRSTITGLIVAVILAGAAVLASFRFLPDGQGSPNSRLLFPGSPRFDAFTYRCGDVDIACHRVSAQNWQMDRPYAAPGNRETIQRFLDAFSDATVLESVSADKLRKRSIDPLAFSDATLTLQNSRGQSLQLVFGTNAVNDRIYLGGLRNLWTDDYKSVRSTLLDVLPTSSFAFRDNHVVPHALSALHRVEIRREKTDPLVFQKTQDGWTLRQGSVECRADGAKVARLLSYLSKARLSFVSDQVAADVSTHSAYGCTPEDATATVRFWFVSDDSTYLFRELLFGTSVEAGEGQEADRPSLTYVRSVKEQFLATVDSTLLPLLNDDIGAFRDSRLFPGRSLSGLRSLYIQPEAGAAKRFERDVEKGVWRLALPVPMAVNAQAFDAYVQGLLSVTNSGLASAEVSSNALPVATLEFAFDEGLVTAKVSRASSPADAAEGETAPEPYLWELPGSLPHLVGAEALSILPWDDDKVLPLLQPEVAGQIKVLAPQSVGDFGLLTPEETLALPPDGPDAAPRVLLLGDAAPGGGRYAMVRGGYTVYVLSRDELEALRTASSKEPTP